MLIFSAALAILVASGDAATPAQPATTPATATAVKEDNPDDKVVCRKMGETGSRLGSHRVCRTVAQWNAMNANGRNMANDAQMHGMLGGPKGN